MPERGVITIPRTAPTAYPTIRSSPFVRAGASGNVSSDPKFIETGMIGTKNVPSNIKFSNTKSLFPDGIENSAKTAATVTPMQTALIVIKYLYVLCKKNPQTMLVETPTIAVAPPNREIAPVVYTHLVGF